MYAKKGTTQTAVHSTAVSTCFTADACTTQQHTCSSSTIEQQATAAAPGVMWPTCNSTESDKPNNPHAVAAGATPEYCRCVHVHAMHAEPFSCSWHGCRPVPSLTHCRLCKSATVRRPCSCRMNPAFKRPAHSYMLPAQAVTGV